MNVTKVGGARGEVGQEVGQQNQPARIQVDLANTGVVAGGGGSECATAGADPEPTGGSTCTTGTTAACTADAADSAATVHCW